LYAEILALFSAESQNTSIVSADTLLVHYTLRSHNVPCLEYKYCNMIFIKQIIY